MEDQPRAPGLEPGVPAPPACTDSVLSSLPPTNQPPEPPHPWLSIWTRPRLTLRGILASNPRRRTILLAALGGVGAGLGVARQLLIEDDVPAPLILTALVVAGALAGIAGLYLGGMLIRLTSGWLEGRGTMVATRAALAWSNVPGIWGLLLWIPLLAAFGADAFRLEPADLQGNPAGVTLVLLVGLGHLVIGVWGFVVFLNCLAEAQGFSAWRALGASLLAVLIAAAPFALAIVLLHSP